MKPTKILVTGGAGYIGSHAVKRLVQGGHTVTVLDNLGHGHRAAVHRDAFFIEGGTGDRALVDCVLEDREIEAVFHFAADIEVGESVEKPEKYYENNFANANRLIGAVVRAGIRKFVFSSTAAVYGNCDVNPIPETQIPAPINPYGRSKLMVEQILADYAHSDKLGYAVLRYFNVAGASPEGEIGEDHRPESHLIPKLLASARDGGKAAIFGADYPTPDGTCLRDYVHVVDLVEAHLLALAKITDGRGNTYNVGSANGFSVREVITACEAVVGGKLNVEIHGRRAGDSATLVAASDKIRRELGWMPKYPDLREILGHAWNWHVKNPRGYGE